MRDLRIVRILAFQVLREQWKNRLFQLILIFGGVIIYAALLLGAMSGEQEGRVLLDFGLGLIELVALAIMLFGCASAILKDMETKTIYLLLSRPIARWTYVAGKYAGLLLAVFAAIAVMGAMHVLLLTLRNVSVDFTYPQLLAAAWLKIAVAGALAVLVSLISTSILSALIMSGIFWTIGHFLGEARFIAEKFGGLPGKIIMPLLYIVPNMELFNLKDALPAGAGNSSWPMMLLYAAGYSCACILCSVLLFERKEF